MEYENSNHYQSFLGLLLRIANGRRSSTEFDCRRPFVPIPISLLPRSTWISSSTFCKGSLRRNNMGISRAWAGSYLMVLVLAVLLFSPLCLAKYERPAVSMSVHVFCRGASHPGCRFHLSRLKDRDLNKRKEACYVDIDNGLWGRGCRSSHITRENCALRCVSSACYNTIYGEDPLEEGEVDIRRGRDFRQCLRREIQEEKKSSKDQAA